MVISNTGTLCCPRKLPNSFPRPTSCPRQSGEVSACNKAKDGFTTWFTNQNLIFYYSGVQWRRRINAPAKTRQSPCSLLSSLLSFRIRWYWLIHWHSPSRHCIPQARGYYGSKRPLPWPEWPVASLKIFHVFIDLKGLYPSRFHYYVLSL